MYELKKHCAWWLACSKMSGSIAFRSVSKKRVQDWIDANNSRKK